MRALLFALSLAVAPAAQAELYRWIDPQSGSVKFSSVPPPWYGDPAREAVSPKVQVINVAPKPAAASPAAVEKAAAQAAAIEAERRREEALRLKPKPEAP